MVSLSTGSADYALYNVTVEVGTSPVAAEQGYYVAQSKVDAVITVAKPLTDFVTGGGTIITPASTSANRSSGQFAADPGTKINFGTNIKYTRSGSNLQGNVNIIFRRTEGGVLKTYQIKSTSLNSNGNSLGVGSNAGDPSTTRRASLVASANIQDVTSATSTFSKGGLSLQLNMTDRGEPGTTDDIAITVWDGSELVFSSSWATTRTNVLTLSGGNLRISGTNTSTPVASGRVSNEARAQSAEAPVSFGLKAYPNPFQNTFTLSIGADVAGEVAVTVVDGKGRSVSRQVVQAATAGEERKAEIDLTNETPGMYLLHVQSGAKREIIKVVKMNR
jgi:hypothetical protein